MPRRPVARAGARDPCGQPLLERGSLGRRVADRNPLVRALQEPVDDFDRRRAGAQDGEPVEQALDAVVAIHERAQLELLADPVALVVHYEEAAVCLMREQVDHARDERLLGAEREGEGVLAPQAPSPRKSLDETRPHRAGDKPGDLSALAAAHVDPELAGAVRHPLGRGRARAAEVKGLHQPVHQGSPGAGLEAGARSGPPGCGAVLGEAEYAFQVVAIARAR